MKETVELLQRHIEEMKERVGRIDIVIKEMKLTIHLMHEKNHELIQQNTI